MSKREIRDIRAEKQLRLLRNHFVVDEENKEVIIPLRYQRASEFLDTTFGKKNAPLFQTECIDKIHQLVLLIPQDFQVKVELSVDDFEGYDKEEILQGFNDTLELGIDGFKKKRRRSRIISLFLILIGALLLLLMFAGTENGWFGTGINSDVIVEIIDIAAWVFIWEAVTLLYLNVDESDSAKLILRQKVKSLAIYQGDEREPLIQEEAEEIFKYWEVDSKIKRIGEWCTLISSIAYISMAFFNLYSAYSFCVKTEEANIALVVTGSVFFFIFHILAGLSGISQYNGRNKGLEKWSGIFALLVLITLIISIILAAINKSTAFIGVSISSFVISIFYVAGYLINRFYNKKEKE